MISCNGHLAFMPLCYLLLEKMDGCRTKSSRQGECQYDMKKSSREKLRTVYFCFVELVKQTI